MPQKDEPSYTELVHDVLRSSERPLTFQELFGQVEERRPITTRNPKGTIRNALTQGPQLVSLGDGRYGYLPHLLQDSLLRLPLTDEDPAHQPLTYTDEVRQALWPAFFEIQKRKVKRPVRATLPNGAEVSLSLEFMGKGVWGSPMPEALQLYLIEQDAMAGDSLLVRVVDGEAGICEVQLEPHLKRDEEAIGERNRELADAAYQFLRRGPSRGGAIWEIDVALLGRGLYRSDVAPDPLESVLRADPRFVETGLSGYMLAEAMTPADWAIARDRRTLEGKLVTDALESDLALGASSPMSLRAMLERGLADLEALLSGQEFGSVEEANAFLQQVLQTGGPPPHRRAETPLEEAQEVMYEAWDARSSRERIRLARKALEISPDCADAYVLLADETARTAEEAADLYARGVAAGERALGKKGFENAVGQFWGILETRPYMRARAGLAEALWAMDRQQEAVDHLWEMLRLNPGDNQGMRYVLLNWLLELGDDVGVQRLFKLYPDDIAAIWAYGRALYAFRIEGDTPRSRKLRAVARKGNRHVPAYLTGRKRLPSSVPETVGFGDESEAVYCAAGQLAAWRATPGALSWIAEAAS